ncbi:MAG: Holliday junction branch migration protein RuvA [Betaproteobacteria bacterium]|nr:Holliday junction branch migration protein RuvA [Betaproteobacteria bacterium]MDE2123745.1 Holliday junction branch migration protein RuvA [Betaproteobacteria bacterium]MDE2185183.1 Holliday junction branch migration protein RuvA [Betaproteobacteria bacterium]MDE2324130.1 Holliday junction branch migration protein RuvA [Betaproteobacteria bacterium]
MIGRIHGTLLDKTPPQLLVDCAGVGYEIDVPMSTLYGLPAVGQPVTLLTHLTVREDAHQLYGFATPQEREAFRALIRISGVGARIALAVLSGLSVNELAQAIAAQDPARLTRVPGIGKKTAERLLLELRGKLGPDLGRPVGTIAAPGHADVLQALLALGYSEREASATVARLPADSGVDDGIRQALKALAKG